MYSRHLAPASFCYNIFIVNYNSCFHRTWLKKVGHKITCPGLVHKGCQDPISWFSSHELLGPWSSLKESLAWMLVSFVFLQLMLPIGTSFLWVACWLVSAAHPSPTFKMLPGGHTLCCPLFLQRKQSWGAPDLLKQEVLVAELWDAVKHLFAHPCHVWTIGAQLMVKSISLWQGPAWSMSGRVFSLTSYKLMKFQCSFGKREWAKAVRMVSPLVAVISISRALGQVWSKIGFRSHRGILPPWVGWFTF